MIALENVKKLYLVRIRPERDAECAGETKVGKLQVAVLIDEQVLGLQVTVENPVRVAVIEPLDEL